MIFAVLLSVITVAFPRAGQKLPPIDRCYMIGAVDPVRDWVTVQERDVEVYRTGAWATMVDVHEGENTIQVGDTNITFTVMKKPVAQTNQVAAAKTYSKLEYAADEAKEPPTNRVPAEITVVIDAGHGGDDTGALSPHGFKEKDANLLLAKAVKKELAVLGYKVVMTRENDTFIKLYDRPKTAHSNNADAFISIHHNAPPYDKDPRVLRYTAVYAWNGIGEGIAKCINNSMAAAFGAELGNNGVPHANFAVTRNPEIPSCLIEVDFITSPEGEEACWDPARRAKVAKAIAAGFADWTKNSGNSDKEVK